MLIPILNYKEHNIIILTYLYSSIPSSASVKGLFKLKCIVDSKKTSVLK